MKVVTGIVSRVRNTAEVSGNKHGIGTTQVLGFRIGRQAVELRMPSLPPIEDGDEVTVAGEMQNGTLIARAYRNYDNRAHGQWKHAWLFYTVFSAIIFLPVPALYALTAIRGSLTEFPYGILCYAIPFLPFPFWALSGITQALKTSHAARLVWAAG